MLERVRRAWMRWRASRSTPSPAPDETSLEHPPERVDGERASPPTDEEVLVSEITDPEETAGPPGDAEEEATGEPTGDEEGGTSSGEAAEDADGDDEGGAPEEEEPAADLSPEERLDQLDEEADIAADFVEGLLDQLGLPGDIEIIVREEHATINVSDVGTGLLIGRRGATLDALQELVRCATQRRTERRSHVRVDVEGYRERQLEKLRDKCRDAIALARETGEPQRLEPMDAYERKMMHDVVAKAGGVTSTSEGAEPRRRVVIHALKD